MSTGEQTAPAPASPPTPVPTPTSQEAGNTRQVTVADVVGATVALHGVRDVFGVLGSGNLVAANALARSRVRFHHARHECSAVCMADGYARVSGRVGVCTVHQGPGLTNAITGLTEAAKSRTPLLVLAGETPAAALHSNFRIDQHDLVDSIGAVAERLHDRCTAADDAQRAYLRAMTERRPVVLMLPIDIQAQPAGQDQPSQVPGTPYASAPAKPAIAAAADILSASRRTAIIAGRGAVLADAAGAIETLGQRLGALLATSAPAHGLFAHLPYALGISGGFATPLAAELLPQADTLLVIGASANDWTTKHGALIGRGARIIHVDAEPAAIGRHRPVDVAVLGDARTTALALDRELEQRGHTNVGFRTPKRAEEIARHRWRHEPFEDATTDEHIDPRTLTIALNELLPRDRAVAIDSGHFMGYPSMYLEVQDPRAWVFANGFQSVGLGLGNAIGAAIASPDRPTVAAIGDGGAFMALAELETAVRLKLMLVVVIYDDAAYGAEVHHFAPMGHDVSLVRFPDVDLAAVARALGAKAATVRSPQDLIALEEWLVNPHGPLVLDAKVNPAIAAEWLSEAFR